ncbi:hypothetical protein CANCADRAFT_2921 [Tortispora caseinolytica NRRL Y-17796]|uniref:Mediator of RNA polymerase II transcription subunit 17 n=1 Tax=Tortispora caseinolytica NRRL Y-17796 TaxID=767744 RepID=A0A1E4THI1_9ASCO|nr:hypothetical protein CANCADRAFT_2921 [Tortispora caseinolytica NRRL Y-17796]
MDVSISLDPPDPVLAIDALPELTLTEKIAKIVAERGSFLNITEETLENEIRDGSPATLATKHQDTKGSLKAEKTAKLLEHIAATKNEAALALDFISLLISAVRPAAGQASMSPLLHQRIPTGSLGSDTSRESRNVLEQDNLAVSAGWKIEALKEAAESLKLSSIHLQSEVQWESKYWSTINELSNKGQALKITPKGLAFAYTFIDSGSRTLDPSVAFLKRDYTSKDFELSMTDTRTKVTVVRIIKCGEIIGEFFLSLPTSSGPSIKQDLDNATYYVFEYELFKELSEEAFTMRAYNVDLIDNTIILPITDTIDINIEYCEVPETNQRHSPLAEFISLLLHTSLCKFFDENRKREKAVPPPVNSRMISAQPPGPRILHNLSHVIGRVITSSACSALLKNICECAQSAGVPCHWTVSPFSGGSDHYSPSELLLSVANFSIMAYVSSKLNQDKTPLIKASVLIPSGSTPEFSFYSVAAFSELLAYYFHVALEGELLSKGIDISGNDNLPQRLI